jgi:hypothetical protein
MYSEFFLTQILLSDKIKTNPQFIARLFSFAFFKCTYVNSPMVSQFNNEYIKKKNIYKINSCDEKTFVSF